MKLDKAEKRERKRNKRKNGMRVSGKSVFVIRNTINKNQNAKIQKLQNKKGLQMKLELSDGWVKTEIKYLIHGITGLYCFCLMDEVMYVGKAIDIKNRLLNHNKLEPEFDVYILEVDFKKLGNYEMAMISKYSPSGNIIGASQSNNPVISKGVGLRLKDWQQIELIAYENRMTVNGVAVKIIQDYLNSLSKTKHGIET